MRVVRNYGSPTLRLRRSSTTRHKGRERDDVKRKRLGPKVDTEQEEARDVKRRRFNAAGSSRQEEKRGRVWDQNKMPFSERSPRRLEVAGVRSYIHPKKCEGRTSNPRAVAVAAGLVPQASWSRVSLCCMLTRGSAFRDSATLPDQ